MKDSIKSNGECQSQATGVIYKLTNTLNGKAYVGKTKRSLNRRIYEHKRDGIKGKLGIGRAIQKYGLENFTAEVIEECPVDKLNEREMFWIRELGTKAPNGYNLTDGGEGNLNPSPEVRAKMSANHADVSGENNPNYGKPRSAETIAKIIAHRPDMSGEKNPHYGKHHSPETRAIISAKKSGENHPFYGKHLPPETCAKISAANKGKKRSPETCAQLSLRMKGKPSPLKGKKRPPETCARMSEARKAYLERKKALETRGGE